MHWIKRLAWRLEVLFRKRSAEAEMDEEIRHHLEMEIRENMQGGMSHREAKRRAMVAFGGVEKTKEQVRDVRGARGLDDLAQDLHLAVRKLKNAPGFTASAVLILALGIGSTVTMFSLLDAAVLRALPFPESQELVMGRATFSGDLNPWCTFPDYLDYRDETEAFEALASMMPGTQWPTVTGGDTPERVPASWVTHDFFRALGMEPQLGRGFLPEEAEASAPPVVVVSHGFWQRRMGGAPEAVGSLIMLEGNAATVVGVMPPGFRFRQRVDLWMPVVLGTLDTEVRQSHSWLIVGRLKDGVGIREAQGQVDVVSARLAGAYPDSHSMKGLRLTPLQEALAEGLRPALLVLLGATGLLLLIACGNVAGLLMARATTRSGEMSLRAAIGATRQRLVRQLLTESLLLAGVAGGLGALLAIWLMRVLQASVPLEEVGIWDVGISGKILGFSAALSFGTAILFGVGPAVTASQVNPADDLKGGRRASAGSRSGRIRSWLVGAQVALSVVLLTGSGLLIRSFVRLQSVELGFPTENLVVGNLAISPAKYPDGPTRSEFFRGVLDDVRAIPGVASASFIDMVPIRDRYRNWFIWDAEHPPEDREGRVSTYSRTVLPGYFETMVIPVLRGRDHAHEDEARDEPRLILSESAAREAFGDQDPVGRRVTVFNAVEESTFEVLGVVADVRITEVGRAPEPQMYYHFPTRPAARMNLVVRARGAPEALVPGIRRVVLGRDPDVPFSEVATMSSIISESIAPERILSVATGLFALTALVLSLTGLYAVLAYYVALRSQEIGIRVAFGADARDVMGLVLRKGMVLVGGGLAAGILGAAIVTRALQSLLYQVTATDPVTFLGVALGFTVVGLLASWAPARKATRVDPVRAIQAE